MADDKRSCPFVSRDCKREGCMAWINNACVVLVAYTPTIMTPIYPSRGENTNDGRD